MISLQKERFSSLKSSTVVVKFCDVIVRPARSWRDLAYTVYVETDANSAVAIMVTTAPGLT